MTPAHIQKTPQTYTEEQDLSSGLEALRLLQVWEWWRWSFIFSRTGTISYPRLSFTLACVEWTKEMEREITETLSSSAPIRPQYRHWPLTSGSRGLCGVVMWPTPLRTHLIETLKCVSVIKHVYEAWRALFSVDVSVNRVSMTLSQHHLFVWATQTAFHFLNVTKFRVKPSMKKVWMKMELFRSCLCLKTSMFIIIIYMLLYLLIYWMSK